MGITSFSHSPMSSALFAPIQALVSLFLPAQNIAGVGQFPPPAGARLSSRQLALPFASNNFTETRSPSVHGIGTGLRSADSPRPSRLRVVREFDCNVSPACAGRMVISGRMADVCAELERMSQRETSL